MALIVLSFLNLWCAYHYFTAGKTLERDLNAQQDLDQQSAAAARQPA
jgi:hypothetical protein